MAIITYKSLTALHPVELHYNFYKAETLQNNIDGFVEGYNLISYKSLENFQDIAINKNTCLILTDTLNLSSIFQNQEELTIGQIPSTINLQPQNSQIYYLGYDLERNLFTLFLEPQNIFVNPINENEVEIRVGNLYLQIEETYPYLIQASDLPLPDDQIYRRRFKFVYKDNTICFICQTKEGDRFLALGPDNVLRGTGTILGTNVLNNYIFNIVKVTDVDLAYNFELKNNWVTYYLDFASQKENETVTINKKFSPAINYLVTFPIQKDTVQNINIANLKTGFTPTGSPTPVDNTYEEQIITTN